jgi:integrase
MALAAPAETKINTNPTQLAHGRAGQRAQRVPKSYRKASAAARVSGDTRESVRDSARVVVEVGWGILVYPPQEAGEPWRAVFTENGRRGFRQARTEAGLAVKLEKVIERLRAGAPGMARPGADLIAHYLDPDRLPVSQRWSRRHADTQRRLCQRFAAPVIATVTCQDITAAHMQQIVNAAPTASEGDRLRRCLSALVTAGIKAGYLTNPRLREIHWQAAGRPVPQPQAAAGGESVLWVDPAEIPASPDVARLGQALARGPRGELDELMAQLAAYTGLRQGELFALTASQVDTTARVITVDRKLVEVAGQQYTEAPKCRKHRATIYPVTTPTGYPLAERLAARTSQARAEQQAGTNPLGLIFPSPRGKLWRSSNFDRRVLAPAYQTARWRDEHGNGTWTWHSLRHVFCTTALFVWKLDATDVSRMAGHANYRITLDMYIGTTAGILDRARQATQ